MQENSLDRIPQSFLKKWQEIADLIANILQVPAALIMKTDNEFMEVFIASKSENNPYKVGDKEHMHGLYCETVIQSQKKLYIPNALKDKHWDRTPDIKLGMIAYLGFPVNFPNQKPFGTLCVLDSKERQFSADNEKLLQQFRRVLELDLALIFSLELKKEEYSHKEVIEKLLEDNKELRVANEELKKTEESLRESETTIRNKLNAILDPEGDIGSLNLADIIDSDELQPILNIFREITNVGAAILDNSGKVLISSQMADICAKFHRLHPHTAKNCLASDLALAKNVPEGTFRAYRCKNNLWDMVSPINIGGKHLGNIYIGQFFYEDEHVDQELFKKQARMYGFDEKEYMAALGHVPRLKRGTVDSAMRFYTNLTRMISSLSYNRIQLSRDIAQRKQAENALRKSEERFRILANSAKVMISMIADTRGSKYLYVNDEWCRVLGYSKEEALKIKPINTVAPECRQMVLNHAAKRIQGKQAPANYELRIITKNGEIKYLNFSSTIINFGNQKAFLTTAIDITDRKLAEEKIRQAHETYLGIINSVTESIYIQDENGVFLEVNNAALNSYGLKREEMIGQTPEILSADGKNDLPSINKMITKALNGEPQRFEFWGKRVDGSIFPDEVALTKGMYFGKKALVAVSRNIAERKQAERKIRQSQQLLQTISDNMFDLVALTDLKGNYTFAGASHKILGYTTDELIGTNVMEYVHPDDLPMVMAAFQEFVANRKDAGKVDYRNRCADGSYLWFETVGRFIRDEKGNPRQILFNSRDITDRKKADEHLRESEERFKKMFEHHSAIMLLIDPDEGTILNANESATRFYGYSKAKLLSMNINKINVLSSSEIKKGRSRAFARHQNYFVFRHKIANGDIRVVEVHSSPIQFDNSEILFSVIHDITERKSAEEELRKLSKAVEQSPAILVITDTNGTIEYVNPMFTKITGYSLREVKGENPRILKSGNHSKQFYQNLWETIIAGKEWKGEMLNRKKDGTTYWESALISPIFDKKGSITHFIAIKEDITDRKMAEEVRKELEIANKTAQFKQNFLANMSHEIRTPLTGVLGMIDIMEQTSLNDNQKDYLDTLKISGENLREIINQVLDYSKIEAGKVSIHPHVFEFASLPLRTMSLYKNNVKAGVKLQNTLDAKIPTWIEADNNRLSQVLNNLVSNAVKFTSQGTITIHSSLLSSNPENGQALIKVEVCDTGLGIHQDLQKKLFVPFAQIEAMDTRNFEGTGLGLSICKQLVEMMDGEIGVISEEGKGSIFWFTFSARTAHKSNQDIPEEDSPVSGKKLRILLAEDKVVNQKVVKLMLTSMGHKVCIAQNGQESMELYQSGRFDLILMDIQMPVMDGITATQKLKERHKNLPPIVGLSANAFEGDRHKYMTLGMDDYLTKPVKRTDFERLTKKLFSQQK